MKYEYDIFIINIKWQIITVEKKVISVVIDCYN